MSNTTFLDGFVKQAKEAGLSKNVTSALLKAANASGQLPPGVDPAAMQQQDIQSQPQPDVSGGIGMPQDIEQLLQILQQLPPEELQALMQQLQGAGGDPAAQGGMPPGAGQDPAAMGKVGSAPQALCEQDAYIEAFVKRGQELNFDNSTIEELYKLGHQHMKSNPINVFDTKEKWAAHFEGFVSSAKEAGLSEEDAVQIYKNKYNAK